MALASAELDLEINAQVLKMYVPKLNKFIVTLVRICLLRAICTLRMDQSNIEHLLTDLKVLFTNLPHPLFFAEK